MQGSHSGNLDINTQEITIMNNITETTNKKRYTFREIFENLVQLALAFVFVISFFCGLGFLCSSPQENEPWLLYKGTGLLMFAIGTLAAMVLTRITPNTKHYRCTKCNVIHIPDYGNNKKLRTRCPVCNKRTVFKRIEEDS